MKTKNLNSLIFMSYKNQNSTLRALLVMLLFTLGVGNAWSSISYGTHYASATTADPAQGLVYVSTSNESNVADSKFKYYYPGGKLVGNKDLTGTEASNANACYLNNGDGGCTPKNMFFWARPARGYVFNGSWGTRGTHYAAHPSSDKPSCNTSDNINTGSFTGTADVIQTTAGGSASTWIRPIASFTPATKYTVTYKKPVGGSYHVNYSYRITQKTGATEAGGNDVYQFATGTEDYDLTPSSEGDEAVFSYAADVITLTVPSSATNFIGWYEGDGSSPVSTNKTYTYTAHANVTIKAEFKELAWGDVSGDLTTNVTAKGAYGGKTVYVAIPTLIGSWETSDFAVAPMSPSNEFGSIAIGTISLDKTSSPNRLVIPYTYTATNWGGVDATFTITPSFGATKQFSVACSAEEIVDYEACIEENEVRTYTGTLAAMMTQANSMNNQPTLKLMQNKTITTPLSFTNSFTFDVNGKVLTANCASAFSIDAAGKDVKIIDGSFTQVGEIHTSNASSGVVSVVAFTQAAKLTMQGGTLSAENTGTGSAYGVNVSNGSIFYMSNGQLTVTGVSEARGVNVATASDYATFNGGSLTVSAPTQAYGLWSAGQSNITDATIDVETTTGANAYGVYVNGGVSTLTTNTVTATAKTTGAYGAYVNAGRLNGNGGSFAAEAVTSGVYGVHVAAGATAMVQMNAVVTAEATGVSGTSVFGINNLGTVSLTNVSVTATSPTTAATAVNTATSAVSTTIDGGTYRANTIGGTAYSLHHQYGALSVDGGTFRAVGGGNDIHGALVSANATIVNATLYGETQGSGNSAYGFKGDVANKAISLSGCTITGKSNTSKAYAIYSNTNVTATGCTLTATTIGTSEAYGIYANAGTNNITNCNATVSANTVKAYGVNHVAGSLTINGGQYDVEAKQATSTGAENSELYGVYNAASQTATVTNASFNVKAINSANSQSIYGAYINGILNSSNSSYGVEGKTKIYGIYGHSASTLNLSGNTIDAEAKNGTTAYGVYTTKNFTIDGDIVRAKGSSTGVYSLYFSSASAGNVLDGKFYAIGNGTNGYGAINADAATNKVYLKGGVYSVHTNLRKYAYTGYSVYTIDDTHPDFADGYRYTIATSNPSQYVCYIKNGHKYETLEAALQYTKDNSGTFVIIMSQNYTLPSGDYVLPSNATLLVPYSADQTTIAGASSAKRTIAGIREEHIRLTLAQGVTLNVDGKIEVGGELWCTETGSISRVNSPYARLHMEQGSYIQLNSGACLYAWGYVTGQGEIKAKNNAEVHEMFQIGGMPSMSNLVDKYRDNAYDFFPINQYYIQNIEVPTTYYYNSRLICSMSNYYKGAMVGNGFNYDDNIKIVGTSGAMFLVDTDDESSWVRKSYNPTNDYQVWEVNSKSKLGSLSITLDGYTLNTVDYILPIANNMKIHVVDGDFSITQSAEFLPGTQVEINKTASLTVKSGQNLYIFDKDQWPFAVGGVEFSPSWTNGSRPSRSAAFVDAAVNVHGNINVVGKLYTSKSIADGTNATKGANIYSTDADAGTVQFSTATGTSDATVTLMTSATATRAVTMELAQLKNGDGTFTSTSNTSSGEAFIYLDNTWQKTYTNGCFEVIGSTVYAKPSGYVALKKSQTDANSKLTGVEETNHTYLTADDKILILMDECQWWEVEATEDPDVFECKKSGYEGFYYYDNTAGKWKLKTVNVRFYSAETGDNVLKTIVTDWKGIPDQSVIASNPTKATTDAATFTFYGWKSSVTGTTYKWTDQLEVATADMSYRPVFTEKARHYTITLNDANNGAAVPLEVAYGSVPEYTATKDPTAQYTYSFDRWEPALAAVTGQATYTAIWSNVINRYTITWMDGETVLETDKNQLYGATTSFDGTNPSKEPDNNYAYAFSGWLNSLTGNMRANNETVTGATTYTAQYTTTPRYKITFANYDGTDLQKDYYVTQGEHPIYKGLTPGRVRDLDGYYRFTGWKNSNGDEYAPDATLPVVTGKETYTAQYDYVNELYLITLNNVDGAGATWSGKFGVGSTPFYNRDNNDVAVEPAKASTDQYEYTFTGWTPELQAVSGEATYTAQFEQKTRKYEITFANLDGNGAQQTIEVEYGQTPVSPVTPEKVIDHMTYAFTGWNTTIVPVAGNATYTAQFSSTGVKQRFTITFNPENGGASQVSDVEYGTNPAWVGADPIKPATAQYTYSFASWYPEVAPVTGEETYSAQYTQTLNKYTVRFVNYDGTELQSSEMTYGVTPAYSDETPKRPADVANRKVYTFDGWSSTNGGAKLNTLPAVNGVATYYAHYIEATFVASVKHGEDEVYKTSWSSAYTDAQANDIIKLYDNLTFTAAISIAKNLTIDLNGHTMYRTGSSTNAIYLIQMSTANVSLTIEDSHGGGLIHCVNTSRSSYAIYVSQTANVTINGGTIKGEKQNTNTNASRIGVGVYLAAANARLYINGGEVIGTSSGGNNYAVGHSSTSNGYTTVTGGKLKGKAIFQNPNKSRITLSGGYYSADPGTVSGNSQNITVATGYEKVATSELSGYTYKVAPKTNIEYTVRHFQQNLNNDEYTEVTADRETKQGTTATATAAEAKDYTGFTAQPFEQGTIAGNGSTVVNIYYNRIKYTVTWLNGEIAIETDENVKFGATPSYDGETPTKTRENYNCVFNGWSPEVAAVEDNTSYTAQFIEIPMELVISDEYPLPATIEVNTTIVRVSGDLDIEEGKSLTTRDLILEASEDASGQIRGNGLLTAKRNVYFDLHLNTAMRHWRAFTVPFEIDLKQHPILADGVSMPLGVQYDIVWYDGAERAANGKTPDCWKYVEDGVDWILTPGRAYMIVFGRDVNTVRFTKKDGASIRYTGTVSVSENHSDRTGGTDGGWNGIGNPATYHAMLEAGVTECQVHNGEEIGSDGYTPCEMGKFIVGKAVFVQVAASQPVVVNRATVSDELIKPQAPRRTNANASGKNRFDVQIIAENGKMADRMFLLADEDKEDKYVILQDLAKAGLSTKRAQIWVDRYDTKLCKNTAVLTNGQAEYPLGIFAPAAGDYTIQVAERPDEETTLYLTFDGQAIWNLTYGSYVASLEKGTTSRYGLRLVRNTPQVATGMDEAVVDAKGETRKVLINDQVFIIRGENVYTIDGQMVK